LFHIHKRTTMTSGNHPPRSVAELFTLSQVVIYQPVTIACLYIKAPVLKTCECFSWRNKHSRVCVTFPTLILAISRLCRLVCYSDLKYGVICCHYPFICIFNIVCRSQKIPGCVLMWLVTRGELGGTFCSQRMFWLSNSFIPFLLIYSRTQVGST
jgi:hypothetical protein